jgi:hypothetical protein
LTDSVTGRASLASRAPERSRSARLGLTVRSILLAPTEGFGAASRALERRAKAGRRPVEGLSTYLLSGLGGASLASLWLKVGALLKVRQVCTTEYIASFIIVSFVLGAVLAWIAQAIWGAAGSATARGLHGDASRGEMRFVWGVSALPQVFVLLLLVPLDLVLVGTDTFTTTPLDESLSTAWAALSIALAISLAVWSMYLFFRGVQVVAGLPTKRAVAALGVAILCFGGVVGSFAGAMAFVPKEASCPTPRA